MGVTKVDTIENSGENWMLADFGVDSEDGEHYILTTNRVHASELFLLGSVREQVELVSSLLNEHWKDGRR